MISMDFSAYLFSAETVCRAGNNSALYKRNSIRQGLGSFSEKKAEKKQRYPELIKKPLNMYKDRRT